VKPEFNSNEGLSSVSASAHLLAEALLCYADDEGFFNANPVLVRAGTCPLRKDFKNISRLLDELASVGYIRFGALGEKHYGQILHFQNHQKISHPTPSKINKLKILWENPPEFSGDAPKSTGEIPQKPGNPPENAREVLEPLCPEQGTGNREQGKEQGTGKGKEVPEGAKNAPSSSDADAPDACERIEPETPATLFDEAVTTREDPRMAKALQEVFAYYLTTMQRIPRTYSFSALRRKKGMARLEDALRMTHGNLADAVELMKAVIDEVARSDFHMGRSAKTEGKSYCEWEDHIFRSTEQFEKWVQRYQEAVRKEQHA